jgi:hypothetical protein
MFETESFANSDVRLPPYPFLVGESAQNEAVSSIGGLDLDDVKKRRRGSG